MKLFFFILSLKFLVLGTLFSQSYWFGGLTRMPGGEEGTKASANIGGQSNSLTFTDLPDDFDELIGFQTFQIGFEGAWEQQFFAIEGGMDLALNSTSSEVESYLDDTFLGFNFKAGLLLKYDYDINEEFTLTPYFRIGGSFEFVTNDLAIPTYNGDFVNVGGVNYGVQSYTYYPGTSLFNTFYNVKIGTVARWKKLATSIELGKYSIVSGDLDWSENAAIPFENPDPLFLQLRVGYNLSDSSIISIGYRTEWWDQSFTISNGFQTFNSKVEWSGSAFDLSYQSEF